MKLYKTTEKLISENYPWGFRLKTTKTDWLEFDKKRGFRHCSQTIDPKTGRACKPKKGVYNDILVIGKDETNDHTMVRGFAFYADKDIDNILLFLKEPENFALFTSEEITYIYRRLAVHIKVTIQAQCTYCGTKSDDLFPLFDKQLDICVKGIKENGINNYFDQIVFDWEKINSLKVEGYQPFKVTTYGI